MSDELSYMMTRDMAAAADYYTPTDGRIRLRAMMLVWPQDGPFSAREYQRQGIALPDGRFIFGGNQTYSSERVLLALNPGARIEWLPDADDVINYVMPEDKLPNDHP